jgi:hypothetical protein
MGNFLHNLSKTYLDYTIHGIQQNITKLRRFCFSTLLP